MSVLLGAFALVTYALMRVGAARFYGAFGLRPEDFRLGYPGLLEQSLGWLALMLVLTFALAALFLGGAVLFRVPSQARLSWSSAVAAAFAVAAIIGLGSAGYLSLVTAHLAANRVRAGKRVQGTLFGVSYVPWHAFAATVIPRMRTSASALAALDLDCVLVLGTSTQGTVVYVRENQNRGQRSTVTLRPADADVQLNPDKRSCDWTRAHS